MMHSVDIAIVGGGMVGLALAATFKDTELRIAVIENRLPEEQISEQHDSRVSALNRATENLLTHLGVWPDIMRSRSNSYTAMEVWEQDSFARIEFSAENFAQPNLGYIVENQVIQRALYEQVKRQSNVTFFAPTQCASIAIGESEAWLSLECGQALTAKLVVGADGANSWVRKQQDIPLTHWDYGHNAIVANIKTLEAHNSHARQIFTPNGPLAFLPLDQPNLSSIVWSTSPEHAERLMSMSQAEFNKSITAEFDNRLGLCEVVSERHAFPLKMRYARDFISERVALVGDAAHTIHPLAGQGVNLGFMDAACLHQQILSVWKQGKDIGALRHLRKYERWRKAEATKMIAAMQGFKQLFDGKSPPKKLLRGVGIAITNQIPLLKEEIMKQALGLKGDLPELACGNIN